MSVIYEGRSHKRLLKDIQKASEKREHLLETGKTSLPSGLGKLAIIVSRAPDYHSKLSPKEQYAAFLEEAERLQQERSKDHQQVTLSPMAVISDIKVNFGDYDVTDIMLIGHGSIGCIWAEDGRYFDWRDAARAASFLKQGRIEQRMCGNLPSKKGKVGDIEVEELPHKYSVALGTFAVTNLENVVAAVGRKVPDVNPSDELFQPVYLNHGTTAPEAISTLNQVYGEQPTVRAT